VDSIIMFIGPAITGSLWIATGLLIGYEMFDMYRDHRNIR